MWRTFVPVCCREWLGEAGILQYLQIHLEAKNLFTTKKKIAVPPDQK